METIQHVGYLLLDLGLPRCHSGKKISPTNADDVRGTGLIPGQKYPLEKEMAPHSSIPAWEIPWTEEPSVLHTVHGGCKESNMTERLNTHTIV